MRVRGSSRVVPLLAFIELAIASTEELDYTEALNWFGVQVAPTEGEAITWRLQIRDDATSAQRAHLKTWLETADR